MTETGITILRRILVGADLEFCRQFMENKDGLVKDGIDQETERNCQELLENKR